MNCPHCPARFSSRVEFDEHVRVDHARAPSDLPAAMLWLEGEAKQAGDVGNAVDILRYIRALERRWRLAVVGMALADEIGEFLAKEEGRRG